MRLTVILPPEMDVFGPNSCVFTGETALYAVEAAELFVEFISVTWMAFADEGRDSEVLVWLKTRDISS